MLQMIVSEVGRITSGSSSFSPPAVRHDGQLGGEAFDVLGFLLDEALGDEQGEVCVDVAGLLEEAVEPRLDVLPESVAAGPDHHAALHRRVVGELCIDDDVDVPL